MASLLDRANLEEIVPGLARAPCCSSGCSPTISGPVTEDDVAGTFEWRKELW